MFNFGNGYRVSFFEFVCLNFCSSLLESVHASPLLCFFNLNFCSALHVALIMKGDGKSKGKAPASSASGTRVPRSATPSSADNPPPEVVTMPNIYVFSSAPPSITNPSDMVSGSGGGGDCPPSHSGGQCSGDSQLLIRFITL